MTIDVETKSLAVQPRKGHRQRGLAMATLLLASVGPLVGCATSPPDPKQMSPRSFEVKKSHARSVSVAVEGSSVIQATDQAVLQSLLITLQQSRVFARVEPVNAERPDYYLRVTFETASPPRPGFTMDTWLLANWRLSKGDTGGAVWQDLITSRFSATPADASDGGARSRIAIEGVVRENIRVGVERLSRLELR